jgi:hypothetical protein
MKKNLTFIALCFFFLTQSSAQSNCSNPYPVTICPGVFLTGQTNAGMGNDAPSPCNITGEDIVYRVYTPGGASKLYVSITSASGSLRLIIQADTCGTSSCTSSAVSAGTSTRTFNISAVNYYTVWVDASSTITFNISFGAATSGTFITIPDTQGNLQFDSSTCATPIFNPAKPFFQVAFNSVYLTHPMTLNPLFVPGVLKVVVFFKNTTGIEAIKRFSFQFNPYYTGYTSISPAPSIFPGVYRAGNWQATGSGNNWTYNFNDSLISGKGDFNGLPNTCLRYEFNFNVTVVSNSLTNTQVNISALSDGFGVGWSGTVLSGCCPTSFATCLGANSGNPATATNGFGFGFADPGSFLPVTLLNFSAEQENDHILLRWTTASEINNNYFTIEKSPDGFLWTAISTVRGAGNSSTTVHYESIDSNPLTGLSYYRLKQTDYDGTSEYFSPVSVPFNTANEIEIFPNPASGQVEVRDYSYEGISVIALYNALGKKMLLSSLKNHASTVLDVSELARGLYLLVIEGTNGDILKQEKIVLTSLN